MPRTLEQHNANDDCSPINTARAAGVAAAVAAAYGEGGEPPHMCEVCSTLRWAWTPTVLGVNAALAAGWIEWAPRGSGFWPPADARRAIDVPRAAARAQELARAVRAAGGSIGVEQLAERLRWGWADLDAAVDDAARDGLVEVNCDDQNKVILTAIAIFADQAIAALEALLALEPALALGVEALEA